jgi:hypothetical protein
MNKKSNEPILSLISVFIIIASLVTLVFLQMEVRRQGYIVLKQTREYKTLQDEHRLRIMRFAKIMRPERLRDLAVTKLTLNEVKSSQIIHMAGEKIALRQ